ncbi:SusD/RagB family nutrient-binding outer membrane lipoprotein [Galbibacter sp. CMA-7]|uniref:SusD/RagB family nutrient-binding outer membrane lipoprotein n=2 Tax=Galbibacter pacificus TaxID=2996052 RepID=A0ABT6FR35_9FLAO|nr:SusD/RagB family nutrient-binding outer membrane lipoprotein [Galbibacter pacificus]MDG3581787.1 SusD/RagB family nutrient-binding outer membrane lipoprotein [Galbibacter pacificus]MDG3585739.1 SusD/RagB family nutrient-binding outer membrane lipoprotein [Galbibacter pacificus]
MMKIRSIILITFLVVVTACTGDFEEINTHPNQLEQITAASPLNPTIYALANENAHEARDKTFGLMQVFYGADQTTDQPFLYDLRQDVGAGFWNEYYRWLPNIMEMEQAAIAEEKVNYQAIALTLKAYAFSMLTDVFGNVPMVEALKGEEDIFFPEYTSQEEIYKIILEDLEKANNLYDASVGMVYTDDILFFNDVSKWQKFTNSLHLRLLLRVSNRPEMNSFQKMTSIINNPSKYPIFTSNEDAAVLQVTGVAPNLSPWDRASDFNVFRYYCEFFMNNLNNFNDPRRQIYATVARGLNDEDYGYIGQPIDQRNNPLPDSIATPSGVSNKQVVAPMIIPMLTYGEVEFIKAELAQRGYLNNAELHYQNGTKAAIELWGAEVPEDYFENEFTAYNGTLERIMLQKYYALYFTDYQSWFEYRRTGFPVLPKSPDMLNNGEMPTRFYYPISAGTMNSENYQKAVEAMGGDEISIKVWWDTEN